MSGLVYERVHAHLEALRLGTVKAILDSYLESSLAREKSFLEVLDYLLDEEVKTKRAKAVETKTRLAGFPVKKTLDEFDYKFQSSIDKNVIRELQTLRFVHNHENVLFLGPPGVGKTHLAIGLGVEAIRAGFGVYYVNATDMITQLQKASRRDGLEEKLRKFAKPRLLILDEIGYLPLDREGAHLFFQLVTRRYERASTIFTSNKPFSEWGEVLGDAVVASAILDRILHHSTVVNIKGDSYRLKNRKKTGMMNEKTVGGQPKDV